MRVCWIASWLKEIKDLFQYFFRYSENKTTEIFDEREIQVIVSTIVVGRATSKHAGNYSCVVPEKAKTTVAVHVLNGNCSSFILPINKVEKSTL